MNNINRLPDAYAKDVESNNYKLLQLACFLREDQREDLTAILESRDLKNAHGKTLDKYGEMVGQSRGGATDEQYHIKLLNQIGRQRSTGSCDDVIHLVAQTLGVDVGSFSLTEKGNATIAIDGLTTETLENSGLGLSEVKNIINDILPVGVGISGISFTGTFEFGTIDEFDENKGFGDIAQTVGGTLGTIA